MAVNYPKKTYGETTTIKRSVVDQIQIVSPKAVPVLKRLSPGMNNLSQACEEVKYEWVEDELTIVKSLLATATITTTTTTAEVTAGHGEYFLVGHIVQIEDEQMLIGTKGTASDVITFATSIGRGWGSTTATTHPIGATVEIIGRAHIEGADAPDDTYTVPTMPFNYCQEFPATVTLTNWEEAIKRYGVDDMWTYQEGKALTQTMKLVEAQMFHGKKVLSAASTPGGFAGFEEYIYSTNKNTLSSKPIKRDDIVDLMREIFALVGEEFMPTLAICNGWVMEKIIGFFEPAVRVDRGETTGGSLIQTIVTPYGNLDLLLSLKCPDSKLFLLNPDMIGLGPMAGLSFSTEDMAKTGTALKRLLVGTYTMEMRNPKTHGLIYGISTTS